MQKDDAEKATQYVEGVRRDDFDRNEILQLALVHLIQTLGEAARRVSVGFRQAHPEIPWAAIVGMRHRVVHDYLHVDLEIVWRVATEDLPLLIAQLRKTLPPESD
jgi:uncharacterized protein with HEPN domain